MNQPIVKINSCEYSKLNENTPVLNIHQIEYTIFVHLNPDICRSLELFQVDNIDGKEAQEVTIPGFIEREGTCWLKIKTEILNTKSGQHIYKLSFVDRITHDVASLYFSYIIQDDNPEKPYIYMNSENSDASSCPCMQSRYSQ